MMMLLYVCIWPQISIISSLGNEPWERRILFDADVIYDSLQLQQHQQQQNINNNINNIIIRLSGFKSD